MRFQNSNTANLDIDMDLGGDFSLAGPGTTGQSQYAAMTGQNGSMQNFSNRDSIMRGRADIVIDPALLALSGPGETSNPPANAFQVHRTGDNSFWAVRGANSNFGFNAPGQGLNNNVDALVSPFNVGNYQSRYPEVPGSSFNATAQSGSDGPHLGEIPDASGPYYINPTQFAAGDVDPSPDTDMETELPGFTNFAAGYEAGYHDGTAAALAAPPAANPPAPTKTGKTAKPSTRSTRRAAPYPLAARPPPRASALPTIPDAVQTVVARLLHPPRDATRKNGHLERRWLALTLPEHFPKCGGYRLRKRSPLWKYGAEALRIPPRYWQWLNGGLVDYSVQELDADTLEMEGLVPAAEAEADDGATAAEAALAEALDVQPPASTTPPNDLEVSPEIQAVMQRMLAPDDKALWHGSGRLKRSWLAKEFPKHFRRNDHHLKPGSMLRTYGPARLGIPEELWRFLTGEAEVYVWPGREVLGRRIQKKKKKGEVGEC
ncbi:hypothetical protein W97_04339 [Coniosporium apollinis CBS 100218]|uniref:Uncharacterized protein n=1 Tax=Coniosporium apollinis (strain CBS 100218) TaxID=1168221 RepID=R7YTH5_CONA1|nr:uncharacterized protein W97_04339 [Coniosporium apollinis CBS 100218]EON65104.1 hypothetical protein W97_04339 [Coniosporium apollinis CBS 100218]